MATFRFNHGRVIRRVKVPVRRDDKLEEVEVDDQPLKTKIVATLGRLGTYVGMPGAGGRPLKEPTYEDVIRQFYAHGVDVIRLNLSHKTDAPLGEVFMQIKEAILRVEREGGNRKRIAVLADLPGPKIRFDLPVPTVFKVGRPFTVHFADEVPASERGAATDVFNAILDGSDAVMMSEETASGKYPLQAIEKMIAIAVRAEWYFERRGMTEQVRRDVNLRRFQEFLEGEAERVSADKERFDKIERVLWDWRGVLSNPRLGGGAQAAEAEHVEWTRQLYLEKKGKANQQPTTDRITQATSTMSESGGVKAIIAATTSGRTVRMISRLRPSVLLTGAAHDTINTRKLAVSYGVLPVCIGKVDDREGTEGIFRRCRKEICEDDYLREYLSKDKTVIFTAGTRLGHPSTTNLIQMREIEEDRPTGGGGAPPSAAEAA